MRLFCFWGGLRIFSHQIDMSRHLQLKIAPAGLHFPNQEMRQFWRGVNLALFTCILLFPHSSLLAQTQAPSLWLQCYTQHKAANGLFLEADAGYRGNELGSRMTTALGRIGAGYHWKAGYATAGLAWFETIDPNHRIANHGEFRSYQKLLLKQAFKQIELNHIYRAEERWLQRADHRAFDFQLRLRYMLQATHSFKKVTLLHAATPFVTANTEIFLVPDDRVFSQYRLYGGGGLVWNQKWKLELGYLHIWLPTNPTGTHDSAVLRTNLTYSW
jgi:Protein of unknown function (DUF2490)